MANELKKIINSNLCPISQDIIVDPVIADDGMTYDRFYIEEWVSRNNTSPITREVISNKFIDNTIYKSIIARLIEIDESFKNKYVEIKKELSSLNDANIHRIVNMYFDNKNRCVKIYGPIEDWNTSGITDMSNLFNKKESFDEDISKWDTSNVTDMNAMFKDAKKFNQPIGRWNVSNVENMNRMFQNARCFNQAIGEWNVSNVKNMNCALLDAINFNQPIGEWDVSNVTTMRGMFLGTIEFNQPIGEWDTCNVTDMSQMF